MGLETYITLQEAVQRFSLDSTLLTTMIDRGRIRGGKLNGTFVLLEDDVRRMAEQGTREQLRSQVAYLEGRPISLGQAARKYGLKHQTLSRWIQAGYIRLKERGGHGRPTLVDESDVAYAKNLADLQQAGQGKQVFTEGFLPDWF